MRVDLVNYLVLFMVLGSPISPSNAKYYYNTSISFNEKCDESSNLVCDISIGLICAENNKCACVHGVSMYFDLQTGNCVRRANTTCGEFTEIGDIANIPCTPEAECVIPPYIQGSRSKVRSSPICKCSDGYLNDNEGKCISVSREPPSCSSNDDCGSGMTCFGNSCVCIDQDDMIYDEISQSCKSLVDTACFLSPIGGAIKDCVDYADCIAENGNPLVGYCKCTDGYDPDANKLCVWDGVSPTRPPPSTVSTTRRSTTSTTEIITTSTSGVTKTTTPNPGLGLIGQPCDIAINITQMGQTNGLEERKPSLRISKCIPNAFCSMGKCACQKGYVPENAKKCVPATGGTLPISTPLLIICIKIALLYANCN